MIVNVNITANTLRHNNNPNAGKKEPKNKITIKWKAVVWKLFSSNEFICLSFSIDRHNMTRESFLPLHEHNIQNFDYRSSLFFIVILFLFSPRADWNQWEWSDCAWPLRTVHNFSYFTALERKFSFLDSFPLFAVDCSPSHRQLMKPTMKANFSKESRKLQ